MSLLKINGIEHSEPLSMEVSNIRSGTFFFGRVIKDDDRVQLWFKGYSAGHVINLESCGNSYVDANHEMLFYDYKPVEVSINIERYL